MPQSLTAVAPHRQQVTGHVVVEGRRPRQDAARRGGSGRVMTAERRWYEPPTPRDWRRSSLAELQSLESSTALRRAILERNSSTPVGKTVDLASYKSSSSSGRSNISEVDRNILERNFPITPIDPLSSPHTRAMRPPAGKGGRPYSLRRKETYTDLNSTYIFDKDWHGRDPLERPAVSLPGSRPRSSTMTKYAPLPSITSNKESQSQPPPLIRSRTFDVIDTKMKNLPTVDDSSVISRQKSEEEEEEPPYVVTVSIEGKTLKEYLSHARDGLLRSRPATKYGRSDQTHENPLLGVSWVSEKPLLYQVHLSQRKESSTEIVRLGEADGESDGEEGAEEEGADALKEAADKDNQNYDEGNDASNNNNDEDEDENTKGKDDDSNNGDSGDDDDSDEEESDDESSDDEDSDDDDNDDDSDDGDETKENNAVPYPQVEEQPLGDDDDINVYFMLPDNSLLLARTTPLWTLAELLDVARGVRVDGRRLKVLLDGVHPQDLHACLRDLGITHNTTVYLLETAG